MKVKMLTPMSHYEGPNWTTGDIVDVSPEFARRMIVKGLATVEFEGSTDIDAWHLGVPIIENGVITYVDFSAFDCDDGTKMEVKTMPAIDFALFETATAQPTDVETAAVSLAAPAKPVRKQRKRKPQED